jgi:hypothetical protein
LLLLEEEPLLPAVVPEEDVADLVLLPDFFPLVDDEAVVAPVADLPPLLLPDDELPDLFPADEPLTAPWPTLISDEARDSLEVVEPDERLLSLPLVRPEEEVPDWLLMPPCIPPEVELMPVVPVPEVLPCEEPVVWFLASFWFLVLSAIV